MTRSLFFKLFVWLALTGGAALALVVGLPGLPLPLLIALLLLGAALLAGWTVRSMRRILLPLQSRVQALGSLTGGVEMPSLSTPYSDFDGLAHALTAASGQMQRALVRAAESRRQLETLLDSMQDAVVAVDGAGRIQWTNQRMQKLMAGPGPELRQTVSGTVGVGHALVHTVRDPEVLECVRLALAERCVHVRRSVGLIPGRIFEVNAAPMPDEGAVAVLHDVTRLEEMERTQRDFVANVSHELRTPLTSIQGYVETLLDNEPQITDFGREFLETILKNAQRMSRLTEDLLVMARVEAAALELNPLPVRPALLMQDSVRAMRSLVQEYQAVLETGEITDMQVFADPDAVLQVMGNLIENAIKYGRRRGGLPARVVLRARAVEDPYPAVEFCVEDFGPGIASDHLPRIFERFYRVDKTRSRESGGTGLGLSIVRHLVQAQGGVIRAESELGAGTRFLFTLPKALYPAP